MNLLLFFSLIEVVNHHPFPIHQPVTVGEVTVMAEAGPNGRAEGREKAAARLLSAAPDGPGLALTWRGVPLGRFTWGLLTSQKADFEPLALRFERVGETPLYTDWRGSATKQGLAVTIDARIYPDGFFDTSVALRNASAEQAYGVYLAAAARWEHPQAERRLMCYDNRTSDFDAAGRTRFSAGEGRHWALQHGVDWLALGFDRAAALVLNSYSQSPTVLDDTHNTRNKSPRFTGANIPQFKNEARIVNGALELIAEMVRDNRPYRDRFLENRMPARGQTLVNRQRIAFQPDMPSREEADHAFLAYNSYRSHEGGRIGIGVPATVFGTSYFPYSTLGENFGELKLPGQQTDAFWPLSADTVTRWRDFAEDIRRDLRIAKAMGFSVIRLHYVDVISKLPEPLQFEYLDFLFGELRHLKLRAMFSTAFPYWTPEQIAARVARYKDVIDRVEIENEVLIWGIPLDRPQYWGRIRSEVKKVAPAVQVHLTAHLNTGTFDRLDDLGVRSDAVSAHAYIDALDAIPSGRGFALAVGSYAAAKGRPAIYTEWNWRGLTRMTPEARADVYRPIVENLLTTRSIREFYQFHLQQTMCVNPFTRKGIRQYEPLWLSRRPKPEAFKLMRLISEYSDQPVEASHLAIDAHAGQGRGVVRLRNRTAREMPLIVTVEAPPEVKTEAAAAVTLPANGAAEIPLRVALDPAALPGFYHVFLRLEAGAQVHYAWVEVRKPGQPQGTTVNLDRPLAVVYGEDAPNIEMEAAYLLAATMESASGREVKLFSAQDVPADLHMPMIVVGSPGTKTDALVLPDYEAAVRFTLSYWMHAKDSAARRIGLVKKKVPAGADVSALP